MPGVPGVGEKTASKLIQEFGSVEGLVSRVDELKGKQKENIQAAADRLTLNKDLARIVTDDELPIEPEDCVMSEWDPDAIHRLPMSPEFPSLLDHLQALGGKPKVEPAARAHRRV